MTHLYLRSDTTRGNHYRYFAKIIKFIFCEIYWRIRFFSTQILMSIDDILRFETMKTFS